MNVKAWFCSSFTSSTDGMIIHDLACRGLETRKSMLYFCFCHCLLLHMSFSKIHWHYRRNILFMFLHSFIHSHKFHMQQPRARASQDFVSHQKKQQAWEKPAGQISHGQLWCVLLSRGRNREIMEGGQASSVLLLRKCSDAEENPQKRYHTHCRFLLFVLKQGKMAGGKQCLFL